MYRLIKHTVFSPINKEWHPDKVLAILFHRSAVFLYFIYFLWGIASTFESFQYLKSQQFDIVQTAFSLLVIPVAALAFVGALYFQKYARLEMYMAASLVTLVVVYEVFVGISVIQENPTFGPSFILNLSHLIIPIVRIIFIYVTLVKQAGGCK